MANAVGRLYNRPGFFIVAPVLFFVKLFLFISSCGRRWLPCIKSAGEHIPTASVHFVHRKLLGVLVLSRLARISVRTLCAAAARHSPFVDAIPVFSA